jgi:hypothetical protein
LLPIDRIPATVSTAIAKQIQATMTNRDLGFLNVLLRASGSSYGEPARSTETARVGLGPLRV